jgi:hypothetical protein
MFPLTTISISRNIDYDQLPAALQNVTINQRCFTAMSAYNSNENNQACGGCLNAELDEYLKKNPRKN